MSLLMHPPRWLRRVALGMYVTGVLIITLVPLPPAAAGAPHWFDKVVHFGMFAGFAALLLWVRHAGDGARAGFVFAISATLAGGIELIQIPLAYRTGDFWDFFWGMVGATGGYVVARVVMPAD